MDPGTAVGATSLGIQVTQGLKFYYSSWKDVPSSVRQMLASSATLSETLQRFSQIISSRENNVLPCPSDSTQSVLEKRLELCISCLEKLQKKLNKIRFLSKIQRATYPFKKSTVSKLREILQEAQRELHFAFKPLGL